VELQKRQGKPSDEVVLNVAVKSLDNREESGHCKLTFRTLNKSGCFTKKEVEHLRPGVVLLCSNDAMLCVLPTTKERIVKYGEVDAMVFQTESPDVFDPDSRWSMIPVGTTLINAYRQFVAVTEEPEKVPFLHSLLGHKQTDAETASTSIAAGHFSLNESQEAVTDMFQLGKLNESQEKATQTFLNAPPESITIIQG